MHAYGVRVCMCARLLPGQVCLHGNLRSFQVMSYSGFRMQRILALEVKVVIAVLFRRYSLGSVEIYRQ